MQLFDTSRTCSASTSCSAISFCYVFKVSSTSSHTSNADCALFCMTSFFKSLSPFRLILHVGPSADVSGSCRCTFHVVLCDNFSCRPPKETKFRYLSLWRAPERKANCTAQQRMGNIPYARQCAGDAIGRLWCCFCLLFALELGISDCRMCRVSSKLGLSALPECATLYGTVRSIELDTEGGIGIHFS